MGCRRGSTGFYRDIQGLGAGGFQGLGFRMW